MCSSHSVSRFVLNSEVIWPDDFNFPPVTQLMKSVWVRCWEHESSWPSVQPGVCVCPSVQPSEGYEMKPPNPSIVPCPDWLTGREKKTTKKRQQTRVVQIVQCINFKKFFLSFLFHHIYGTFRGSTVITAALFKKNKKTFFACDSVHPCVHSAICPSIILALDNSSKSTTITCQTVTCSIISPSRKRDDEHCRELWLADGPEKTTPS